MQIRHFGCCQHIVSFSVDVTVLNVVEQGIVEENTILQREKTDVLLYLNASNNRRTNLRYNADMLSQALQRNISRVPAAKRDLSLLWIEESEK